MGILLTTKGCFLFIAPPHWRKFLICGLCETATDFAFIKQDTGRRTAPDGTARENPKDTYITK